MGRKEKRGGQENALETNFPTTDNAIATPLSDVK
jgi:hypothetical protein